MIPKKPPPHLMRGGYRFPACAKPFALSIVRLDASAREGRSEKIMLQDHSSVVTGGIAAGEAAVAGGAAAGGAAGAGAAAAAVGAGVVAGAGLASCAGAGVTAAGFAAGFGRGIGGCAGAKVAVRPGGGG